MATTFKNIVNRFNTTIKAASSINNTDDPVTFNITDATGIPAVPFYFTVEQLTDSSVFERMLATAVDGDEIVATRAQDGSSKQTFAAGDLVQIRVMAAHIDDMTTVINALEDGTALLAGRSGGQTLIGGTASGNDLILQSSSDATKGKIYFGIAQTSYFDETTENLFILTLNGLSLTSEMTGFTISGGGINSKFLSVVDDSYINQDLQTGASPSFADLTLSGLTASELTATDANKKLQSLAVDTYPSLTEISYVKGLTSAIQTQLNGKASSLGADDNYVTDAEKTIIGNTSGSNTGDQDLSGKANVDQSMYIGTTEVAINRGTGTLNLAGIGTLACGTITVTGGDLTLPGGAYGLNLNPSGTYGKLVTFASSPERGIKYYGNCAGSSGWEGVHHFYTQTGAAEAALALTLKAQNAIFVGAVNLGTGVIFPTSDPSVSGQWWDNAGTLTKSSG